MPVIPSLFGGSCRDDLISFSSLNTWDAVDGLFPASRSAPAKEMRMPPPNPYGSRVRYDDTAGRRTFHSGLRRLRMDDVKLKEAAEGAATLRARSGQSSPQGGKQRPSGGGGETSPGGLRRRILLPDDAEAEQMRAAIRNGILMITSPRKGAEKKGCDPSTDRSGEDRL